MIDFNKFSVKKTTDISIYVQIISLIVSFSGIFYKLPKEHLIIRDLLMLETTVQIIELGFYLALLKKLAENVTGMAKARYYDWFITTPTMLLTTIVYFEYLYRLETNGSPFRLTDFIKENERNIIFITIANFLMLMSGYLYETGKIDKNRATLLGYIFFLVTFGYIYNNYAQKSKMGKKFFALLFIIWGSYGLGFILSDVAKNNVINFLDLFAKNFFGVFLFYRAYKLKI
jgi:bacteriorhodopsin